MKKEIEKQKKIVNVRALEIIAKGFASKRRIAILIFLEKQPEADLTEIAAGIKLKLKSTSEHVRKMAIAGMLMKRNEGNRVLHKLTSRGESALKYLRSLL
jgi:DNA-binding transcriptional ArsR family regulator